MTVGIPRALLYYRFKVLWETFFSELGVDIVLSPMTDKSIEDQGIALANDENCLSTKIFFGHVKALIGKCDYIFVPRIASYNSGDWFCSRFEALYDMCVATFRDEDVKFLTCNVDEIQHRTEKKAFTGLGKTLGKSKNASADAYFKARTKWERTRYDAAKLELEKAEGPGMKVLLVGHSYNLYDKCIGEFVEKKLEELGVVPIMADRAESETAREEGQKVWLDIPWMVNRELLGAVCMFRKYVDGIILMTAFPCGPDSMTDEMVVRRVKDLPILNLLLDAQDGSAGIETRLESFVDIIRFRKEAGLGEDRV